MRYRHRHRSITINILLFEWQYLTFFMIKFLIIIINLLIQFPLIAQDKTVFINYKANQDKNQSDNHKHWFYSDKVLIYSEDVHKMPLEITIWEEGKFVKTSDTIRYKKQFMEAYQATLNAYSGVKQPIKVRYYNSNIVRRTQFNIGSNANKYLVIDTLNEMSNWELLNDTMTIMGFACQKAVTVYRGTKYFAYFAPSLKYPAGPMNFRGLPGLILKVISESGKTGYYASEIQMPYNGIIPKFESDGIIISQKEYLKLAEEENKKSLMNLNNIMTRPNIKQ